MPRPLLYLLLFSALANAQSPDMHSRIMRLADSHDYAGAVAELRGLSESKAKLFYEKNYDYLLARMCERIGDLQCAAASYAAVAGRDSELRAYALWHLAHISATAGNLLAERVYLMRLLAEHPGSLQADAAEHRLARSWYGSGNYAMTITQLARSGAAKGSRAEVNRCFLRRRIFTTMTRPSRGTSSPRS